MVLPKAGLDKIYWADGSNLTFVILMNGSAVIPRLRQYPIRYASQSMRLLTFITLLLFTTLCFSQDNEIIKLAFSDRSNFDITTFGDNKKPTTYYVLNKTDKWNKYRFHLNEDLTSDSVRKKLEQDEHSYYNHSYIFRDTIVDRLFSDTVKQHLYKLAQSNQPRQLADTFKVFKVIKSFGAAKNGFFFSVTDPIFTQDKQYAFIDIAVYIKNKYTEDVNYAYFGMILLIYENIKGKGWTRIQKFGNIIL